MRILISLALLVLPLGATQKVFLHDAASSLQAFPGYLLKNANGTQGTSNVTAVTNTIVGPVPAGVWYRQTSVITKTAAGTPTVWITQPLSAGFTIAGTITPNIRGLESSTAANSGFIYEVWRWSKATGGVASLIGTSTASAEWTASDTAITSPTLTPTSTVCVTGDRLLIVLYNTDGLTVTETASARTMTIDYDAGTGVAGDTYLLFTENLTFSADSNNQPPRSSGR